MFAWITLSKHFQFVILLIISSFRLSLYWELKHLNKSKPVLDGYLCSYLFIWICISAKTVCLLCALRVKVLMNYTKWVTILLLLYVFYRMKVTIITFCLIGALFANPVSIKNTQGKTAPGSVSACCAFSLNIVYSCSSACNHISISVNIHFVLQHFLLVWVFLLYVDKAGKLRSLANISKELLLWLHSHLIILIRYLSTITIMYQ